jgi:hypothetical protein
LIDSIHSLPSINKEEGTNQSLRNNDPQTQNKTQTQVSLSAADGLFATVSPVDGKPKQSFVIRKAACLRMRLR